MYSIWLIVFTSSLLCFLEFLFLYFYVATVCFFRLFSEKLFGKLQQYIIVKCALEIN